MSTTPTESAIRAFRIEVPEHDLAELRDRLARVRWPPESSGGADGYGVPIARIRELVEYWRESACASRSFSRYPTARRTLTRPSVDPPELAELSPQDCAALDAHLRAVAAEQFDIATPPLVAPWGGQP